MKIVYVLMAVAFLSIIPVKAGTGIAYVRFNVTNHPPKVENITLIPENPFPDSILECSAVIYDEDKRNIRVYFEWYKNDILLEEDTNKLSDFKAGDIIKCKITPNDLAQNGTPTLISVIIQKPEVTSVILKNTLNFLGSNTNLEEISSYQQEGFNAVTGFVVAEGAQNKGPISLIGILFILIIVNINLIVRRLTKKRKIYKG